MTDRWSQLLGALRCPRCGSELLGDAQMLTCGGCGETYEVVDGVPRIVAGISAQSRDQASWFDENEDAEWEIERPAGGTRLYRWQIEEKLRRSLAGLSGVTGTGLVVCGGSGMEAEYLARRGFAVVTADISAGAASRAAERGRRHGAEIVPVVADAARLPFADRSFDLVYVHDGLHHLDDPFAALAEMARVARRAVSVNEPADAAVTQLAARVGLAELVEEAGNRVERLSIHATSSALAQHGFRVVHARRYALLYRHTPGAASRVLSMSAVFPTARRALRAAALVAGPVGNKLTVQAVRDAT